MNSETNCTATQDQLVDYLYGEMAPRQRQRFEQHLNLCPDCRHTLEAMGQTSRILQTQTQATPPGSLVFTTQEKTDRGLLPWSPSLGRGFRTGVAAGLAVAALFVIAVVEVGFDSHQQSLSFSWGPPTQLNSLPPHTVPPPSSATLADLKRFRLELRQDIDALITERAKQRDAFIAITLDSAVQKLSLLATHPPPTNNSPQAQKTTKTEQRTKAPPSPRIPLNTGSDLGIKPASVNPEPIENLDSAFPADLP